MSAAHSQYITFTVGAEEYGVDVMAIREICGWMDTTALPEAPDWMCGVANLRGEIIPIIDLRRRFGGDRTRPAARNVVIVVTMAGVSTGLLADAVADIVGAMGDDIRPIPDAARMGEGFLAGLLNADGRMVALLDLDRVVGHLAVAA